MAAEPKLKTLPLAGTTALFRDIERHLKADPILKATVKTWRTWEGDATRDTIPPSNDQAPWVRLTPRLGGEGFFAASTQVGPLFIDVELYVAGSCADDLLNLWWAMQRALYSANAATRNAFQTKLGKDAAWPGIVTFTPPSVSPESDKDHLEGTGTMKIDYRFDVVPSSPGI